MPKFIKVVSFNKTILLNIETISEVYPEEGRVCRTDGGILYIDNESLERLMLCLQEQGRRNGV